MGKAAEHGGMRPAAGERAPIIARGRAAEKGQRDAKTTGGPTFLWVECPDHRWYGVSVIVTAPESRFGLCVPPLDGTAQHWVPVAA